MLIINWGHEGYWLFNNILEYLFTQDGKIDFNIAIEVIPKIIKSENINLKEFIITNSKFNDVGTTLQRCSNDVKIMLEQCSNNDLKLFEIDTNNVFFSPRLLRDIEEQKEVKNNYSRAGKASAKARSERVSGDINDVATTLERCSNKKLNDVSTIKMKMKMKEEGIIKENIKEKSVKIKSIFSKPTEDEVCEYFLNTHKLQLSESEKRTEKFYNFYESKNWFVGKNKMSNWKAAATNSLKWEIK